MRGVSEKGPHLYARPLARDRSGPRQLLVGHTDTVWPHGTLATMPIRRDGDRLFGPGVYDMKAGLVEILFALRGLAACGLEPEVTPVIFLNSDEEIGSGDSTPYLRFLARGAERAFILEAAAGRDGRLRPRARASGAFASSSAAAPPTRVPSRSTGSAPSSSSPSRSSASSR